MPRARNILSILTTAALLSPDAPLAAQEPAQRATTQAPIRVTTELVLVNVVAHDKKGNLIKDLKREDFNLYEDGKKQDISSFDFEDVDALPATAGPTVSGAAAETPGTLLHSSKKAPPTLDARDRRLILLFFDFSAMQPEEIDRSVDAAKKSLGKIYGMVQQQAAMLSFVEAFWVLGLIFVCMIPLLLLLRNPRRLHPHTPQAISRVQPSREPSVDLEPEPELAGILD